MTPQSFAAAAAVVISFTAGILSSRGIISKETQDYLAGPETLSFLGVLGAAVLAGYSWYANRSHAQIQNTNKLKQVDAVIVKPKTADEISMPGVVGSVDDAAKVVPVRAHKAAHH